VVAAERTRAVDALATRSVALAGAMPTNTAFVPVELLLSLSLSVRGGVGLFCDGKVTISRIGRSGGAMWDGQGMRDDEVMRAA
jgi:hypothetical protein